MVNDEAGLVQRALGVLEGTVRGLADQWSRQYIEAMKALQRNNDKLETLTRQVDQLNIGLQNVQQTVAEMKNDYNGRINPALHTAEAERNQRIGSRTVWVLFTTGAATVLTAIGFVIDRFIKYLSLPSNH